MICTISEVAERCNVTRQTVSNWIRKGYLKQSDRGEVELFPDLESWVDENTKIMHVLVEK